MEAEHLSKENQEAAQRTLNSIVQSGTTVFVGGKDFIYFKQLSLTFLDKRRLIRYQ